MTGLRTRRMVSQLRVMKLESHRLGKIHVADGLDIGAGRENFRSASEHNAADTLVRIHFEQRRAERIHQRVISRIKLRRPVQGNDADPAFPARDDDVLSCMTLPSGLN